MFRWIRWKFSLTLDWLRRKVAQPEAWECYFCHRIFSSSHPRINAYKGSQPLYQCEECRVRLDLEITPTDPKLFDSDG